MFSLNTRKLFAGTSLVVLFGLPVRAMSHTTPASAAATGASPATAGAVSGRGSVIANWSLKINRREGDSRHRRRPHPAS
jgi:hypothetical protein